MANRVVEVRVVLLTGATGHVGTALLPRLVSGGARVLCLIRAKDADHLAERLERLLVKSGADPAGVEAVIGDVSAPGLGLSEADRARVLAEVDQVIHSATSVRFDMPAEDAAQKNIGSTEGMLALCGELGSRLRRYDHVSTCYVAGDRRGRVLEGECDEGQGFRNSYEWSKCQSEKLVRAAGEAGLPICIHRPAIVVGDSSSGATESFNVMYWPLKLYVRGWWRTFPGSPDATCDIVPVDWVAEAIARLSRDERAIGRCFHLAVGEEAPTVQELVEKVRSVLGGKPLRFVDQRRYVRFVRPAMKPFMMLTKRGRTIRRGGDAFLPYFSGNPVFDTTGREELLPDLPAPPVMAYLDTILRFAAEKDFGG